MIDPFPSPYATVKYLAILRHLSETGYSSVEDIIDGKHWDEEAWGGGVHHRLKSMEVAGLTECDHGHGKDIDEPEWFITKAGGEMLFTITRQVEQELASRYKDSRF